MVLRVDVVAAALDAVYAGGGRPPRVIALTPQGRQLDQALVEELALEPSLAILSSRFEGFDERIVEHLCTDAVSIGPYVLSGGELPAMVLLDAIARRLPGALAEGSGEVESFSVELDGGIEYPHYTRPAEFRGWRVPDVLLSGDHGRIATWRRDREPRAERPVSDETPRRESVDEWIRRLSAGFDELTGDEPPASSGPAASPASAATPAAPSASAPPAGPPSAGPRAGAPEPDLVTGAPAALGSPSVPSARPTVGQWGRIEDPLPWSGAAVTRPEPETVLPPLRPPAPERGALPVAAPVAPQAIEPEPVVAESGPLGAAPVASEPSALGPGSPRSRLDWPARSDVPDAPAPEEPVGTALDDLRTNDWQARSEELRAQLRSEPVAPPPPPRREDAAPVATPAEEPVSVRDPALLASPVPAEPVSPHVEPEVDTALPPSEGAPPQELPPPPRRRSRNPIDRLTEGWPHRAARRASTGSSRSRAPSPSFSSSRRTSSTRTGFPRPRWSRRSTAREGAPGCEAGSPTASSRTASSTTSPRQSAATSSSSTPRRGPRERAVRGERSSSG